MSGRTAAPQHRSTAAPQHDHHLYTGVSSQDLYPHHEVPRWRPSGPGRRRAARRPSGVARSTSSGTARSQPPARAAIFRASRASSNACNSSTSIFSGHPPRDVGLRVGRHRRPSISMLCRAREATRARDRTISGSSSYWWLSWAGEVAPQLPAHRYRAAAEPAGDLPDPDSDPDEQVAQSHSSDMAANSSQPGRITATRAPRWEPGRRPRRSRPRSPRPRSTRPRSVRAGGARRPGPGPPRGR